MDRVTDLADPNRCKGAAPDGQCRNLAEEGDEYCRAHGGSDKLAAEKRRSMYLLTRHRGTVARFAEHEDAKTLKDEIAMVRTLILEHWNRMADTDAGLISSSGQLNHLWTTLERLMKTAVMMDRTHNETLSKTTIIVFGREVIDILKEELRGVPGFEDKIDRITTRMFDTIEHTANTPED